MILLFWHSISLFKLDILLLQMIILLISGMQYPIIYTLYLIIIII